MFLAKIVGKIVSVTKNEGLHGKKNIDCCTNQYE